MIWKKNIRMIKMNKNRNNTFTILAKIVLETNIEVSASSMEEALEKSKSLKINDFIDIHGDHLDSELDINGVYK